MSNGQTPSDKPTQNIADTEQDCKKYENTTIRILDYGLWKKNDVIS